MCSRARLALVLLAFAGVTDAAHAAPTWLPPVPLSAAGADGSDGDVAMSPSGDVIAVWTRASVVESVIRPAGGPDPIPAPLDPGGPLGSGPVVAVDAAGNAVAAWVTLSGVGSPIRAAFRPAGGGWGAATEIPATSASSSESNLDVAFDAAGNATLAWISIEGSTARVRAARAPRGGPFGAPATLSATGDIPGVRVTPTPDGETHVLWGRTAAGTGHVEFVTFAKDGRAGPVTTVESATGAANSVQIALDRSGTTVVAYLRFDGSYHRLFAASRPPGGTFGTPQPLSATANRSAAWPDLAVEPGGTALLVWQEGAVRMATRPPGGTFTPGPQISPPTDHDAYDAFLAMDPAGTATVVWAGNTLQGYRIHAATRPAGGTFGVAEPISATVANQSSSAVAMDAFGDAVALWQRYDGTKQRIELAGLDAAGPQLRSLSPARSGFAGTALPFSVDAVDVWSPVSSVAWAFGDGATASGAQASHAYAAPGTYGASVTATDALGNAATAAGTVTIAPTPVPVPGRPITPPDRTAPALTALTLSPARFRAASRGAPLAATAVGTTVRFTLSEAASVRFTAQRVTTGRRVGRTCRKTTAANRRRARCTRYVAVKGSATRTGVKGANRVKFRGRLGGRRLAPGRYRLLLRATDAAGNDSALRRVSFRVVRR